MPRRVITPAQYQALRESLGLDTEAVPRFPQRLSELRAEHGMSQQELADVCGMISGRGAIGGWEAGTGTPDLAMMLLLGDFFGVSQDYLVGIPHAHRDSLTLQRAKATLNARLRDVDWTSLTLAGRVRETWRLAEEAGPHAFPVRRIRCLVGGLKPESFSALVNGLVEPSSVAVNRLAWALGITEQLLLTGRYP